jgi:hypothetical protein
MMIGANGDPASRFAQNKPLIDDCQNIQKIPVVMPFNNPNIMPITNTLAMK